MTVSTSLFFPLVHADVASVIEGGWNTGPYATGRTAYLQPGGAEQRAQYYTDSTPLHQLIGSDRRAHRLVSKMSHGGWDVQALELVGGESNVDRQCMVMTHGYLLVHMRLKSDAKSVSAMTALGEAARPGQSGSQQLLNLARSNGPDGAWRAADAARVYALSLTDDPAEDSDGSVSWPGSTALQRRVASLLVLPARSSVRGGAEFPLQIERVTPSFDLCVGRWATVAVRRRLARADDRQLAITDTHVTRMRTDWCDAVLLELVERDALGALLAAMRGRQNQPDSRTWRSLQQSFRDWRTRSGLLTPTEDPFENALSGRLRQRLTTADLARAIEDQLRDHAEDEASRGSVRLTQVVALLAVVSAVFPFTLALANPQWRSILRTAGWWLSVTALGIALVWGLFIWRRGGRGRSAGRS